MSDGNAGYILTEIWKAKPSWLALSVEHRSRFFEEKIGPLIGDLVGQGAEILGCAINDNSGNERIDYRYIAIWKMPNRALSEQLEARAKEAGFLDYFDQVNFSGDMIPPDVMNGDMIRLQP